MKKTKIALWALGLAALPVVAISVSVFAQVIPLPPPVPGGTILFGTQNTEHFKSTSTKCTTQPLHLTISGIAYQSNGSTSVGNFSLTFGSGSGTQYRTECDPGGNSQTCQLVNCQGQTMLTFFNTKP